MGENCMPEVREICVVKCSESIRDSIFYIHFDNIIRAEIPYNGDNIEDVYRQYYSVVNHLLLNGYVNLCLGELNCPLENGWQLTSMALAKIGVGRG